MVPYVSAGQSPTAVQLNALIAELDGLLHGLFGGKSWIIYERNAAEPEGRRFYFGDVAQRKILPPPVAAPVYDHGAFTSLADSYTVHAYDPDLDLAFTDQQQPDPAHPWPLDGSLEAHTRLHQGPEDTEPRAYWLCNQGLVDDQHFLLQGRERYRRLDVAEIVIEGWTGGEPFVWNSTWNKFHCLRFHNLDPRPLNVELPGLAFSVPAFGIQALRRTYPLGAWDKTYTYLWRAVSGDSLLNSPLPWTANPIANLRVFHEFLDISLTTLPSARLFADASIFWDGSSLLPQPIGDATELAKYLVPYRGGSLDPGRGPARARHCKGNAGIVGGVFWTGHRGRESRAAGRERTSPHPGTRCHNASGCDGRWNQHPADPATDPAVFP